MSKAYARTRAEEKKKNSSASSQSSYEKMVDIYEKQKTLDIQAAQRAEENFTRASTNNKYNANLNAYLQRLQALRGYGYNTSTPIANVQQEIRRIQPAVQAENEYLKALQGMSLADRREQIRLPMKYANAGRAKVDEALARLQNQIGGGKIVASPTGITRNPNAKPNQTSDAYARSEYEWLKQHQYEFWTREELQSAIRDAERQSQSAGRVVSGTKSTWSSASMTPAQQAEAYLQRAQAQSTKRTADSDLERMRAALYPKVYGATLARLPEDIRNDVLESGRWQEEARSGVNNWQYEADGEAAGRNAESAAQKLESLRKRLKARGMTAEQIEGLLNYGKRTYNAGRMQQAELSMSEYAKEHPVLSSAGSIPMNLLGGMTGYVDAVVQRVRAKEDAFTGGKAPIDYNSGAQMASNLSTTARSAVGKMANEALGLGDAGNFLYNTGMSILDSTLSMATGNLLKTPYLTEFLLSGSAAQQSVQNAHMRGATDEQALWSGFASGLAEAFFEHMSIENLRSIQKIAQAGRLGGKAFWKAAGTQALVEGSEEGLTTLANTVTDAIIMGDLSEINLQIRTNMMGGMDERDAIKSAWRDWVGQVALDTLGGIISGGVIGVGGGAIGVAQNRAYQRLNENYKALNQAAVKSYAERFGKAAPAVERVFNMNTTINAGEFQKGFEAAYYMGREGAPASEAMQSNLTQRLTEMQRQIAWDLGRDARQTGAEPVKLETLGGVETNGREVDLRNGGERDGGTNPAEQVQGLESGAGQAAGGIRVQQNAKDAELGKVRFKAEAVSPADLVGEGGSTVKNLYIPEEGSYTPKMRKAVKTAAKRGVKLHFFSGGNLEMTVDGERVSARGMADANGNVWVRIDHDRYSADQIAQHETTHSRIRRGEVNLQAVRESMTRELGGEEAFNRALDDYKRAYDGSGLSEDAVFEEMVSDAAGGMNIFEGAGNRYAEAAERTPHAQSAARKAVREAAKEGGKRAPPVRETAHESAPREAETTPAREDPGMSGEDISRAAGIVEDLRETKRTLSGRRSVYPTVQQAEAALRENGFADGALQALIDAGRVRLDADGRVVSYGRVMPAGTTQKFSMETPVEEIVTISRKADRIARITQVIGPKIKPAITITVSFGS